MKAIRKMDEYLICKHWRLFFLLFFGICIGGGTLCLWLMARGGSGFRLMINFTLAAMMFLAGSFVVPLTVWLEEKEIGFSDLSDRSEDLCTDQVGGDPTGRAVLPDYWDRRLCCGNAPHEGGYRLSESDIAVYRFCFPVFLPNADDICHDGLLSADH